MVGVTRLTSEPGHGGFDRSTWLPENLAPIVVHDPARVVPRCSMRGDEAPLRLAKRTIPTPGSFLAVSDEGDRTDTATVLFTDLAGSTELRSRLGEEAADVLRHVHDRLVSTAIEANRGTVVKHLGDGMMATFTGAADGLAGAVAVQQAIDEHNRNAANEQLMVRIGVSVGDVSFEGDDCFGLPVVEAQRLEATAEPGQIRCTDLVQLMSRGRGGHTFIPIGDLELKGIEGRVAALEVGWAPVAAAPRPSKLPRVLTTEGSFEFAGRDQEFETLLSAWKTAVTGVPGVVLVSGEPGIGKTRLVSELARRAMEDDVVVMAGRCDEHVHVAYRPFVDALAQVCRDLAGRPAVDVLGPRAGELRRLLPDLDTVLTEVPETIAGDPEFERFQVLDAIAGAVATISTEVPVLLVLDDLHWAEGPTLAALRHLVEVCSDSPLLVVGTYRDTDLDRSHPLSAMLADFRRRDSVSRLDLVGLNAGGVEAFLERAAGHTLDEAGAALAAAVHSETAGNPFFVGEVLRHLAESGAIVQRDGVWTSDLGLDQVGIPEGIREVVGRRLNRLSDDAGRVLAAAAIVGHEFEVDVVTQLVDVDIDSVLDALDEAAAANLVLDDGVDHYRFAHALVRTTLEEELSTTRRARLHRKAALALEDLHAGHLDDIAPQLAHHWAETADPDPTTAIRWAVVAGLRNLAQAAPDDALRWFESGFDLLDPDDPDPATRAELLVCRAEARMQLGDAAFEDDLLGGARAALTVGDASLAARALMINPRTAWTRGVPVDTDRLAIIDAAQTLVDGDDHLTRLQLLLAKAEQELFAGDDEGRMAAIDEAIRIIDSHDVPLDWLGRAIGHLGMLIPPTHRRRADIRDVVEAARVRIEAAGDTAAGLMNGFGRCTTAITDHDRAAYDRSRDELRAARAMVSGQLPTSIESMLQILEIIDGQMFGRLDAMDAAADRLVEVSTAQTDDSAESYRSLTGFSTARERGTLPELLPILEALHSDVAPGPAAAIKASGLALAGATDLALAELERFRPFDDVADDPGYFITVCCFADAASVLNHAEAARELLPLLDGLEEAEVTQMVTGCFAPGAVTWWIARLHAAAGHPTEAEDLFVRAHQTHDTFGATAHQARARVDHAEFCLDQDRPDDARRLASEALDLVGDGELVDTRNRAERVLTRARLIWPVDPDEPGPAGADMSPPAPARPGPARPTMRPDPDPLSPTRTPWPRRPGRAIGARGRSRSAPTP